jgi:hypothetical protein
VPIVVTTRPVPEDDLASLGALTTGAASHVASLQCQLAQQERKLKALENRDTKKKAIGKSNKVVEELRELINNRVWTKVKFIPDLDALLKLTKKIFGMMNCAGFTDDDGNYTRMSDKLAPIYQDNVAYLLNEVRNGVIGQIKNEAIRYMRALEVVDLPPDEEFLKILKRDKDLNEDLFEWYWDKLLPKAHPIATNWNQHKKYFGLISTHAPPDSPQNPYISWDTEAFVILCIMNYRGKWNAIMKEKKPAQSKFVYIKDESKRDQKPNCWYVNMELRPEFNGKWSLNDSGQAKFGGWSKEGQEQFRDLRKIARETRENFETYKAIEEQMLDRLRTKYKIQGDTWEQHLRRSKPLSGRARPAAEKVEGIFDLDWD